MRALKRRPLDDSRLKWWAGTAIGVALLALLIDQPLLLVLALLLGLAAASAWCWWRFGLSEVSFERHLSAERAAFGEEIEIELAIENAKPLPLVWLDVQDEFPEELPVLGATIEPNEKSRRVTFHTVFSAGPYERVRRRYRISCAKRGLFSFGPATLQTGDPFGFSRRADLIPGSNRLIVYPEIKTLVEFGLPAELPLGERMPIRPLVEDPFSVEGIRPYLPGDHPRRIDWRASARTGEMQTKRYERRASPSLAIFLDTNTFEHFWEGADSKLMEHAITVAASVAVYGVDRGYQVGLTANAPTAGSAEIIRIPASAQAAQLPRLLEALALLVGGTGIRIEKVIGEESARIPWGMSVVVVTPNVTDGMQLELARLARRGHRPVLIACGDEPSLAPGLAGRVHAYHLPAGKEGSDGLAPVPLTG